jgi:hypothetical protein
MTCKRKTTLREAKAPTFSQITFSPQNAGNLYGQKKQPFSHNLGRIITNLSQIRNYTMTFFVNIALFFAASWAVVGAKSNDDDMMKLKLTVTNLSFDQPFSPFFVMVHNEEATPLYKAGKEASEALAILAENGSPGMFVVTVDGSWK